MDIPLYKKLNRRVRMLKHIPMMQNWHKLRDIAKARPYSVVDYPRLAKAYDLILESETFGNLEGAIVEAGSWNGGYARVMLNASERADKKRNVWLFDSFEGGPKPLDIDRKINGKLGKYGPNGASPELCRKAFTGIAPERLHIVEGWFDKTFPTSVPQIGSIAYLHLDVDFYESTKICLEWFYPLVAPGGLILFDDYSYYMGCKKAVDEFLKEKNLEAALVHTVEHSAYLRKPFA